ncbi:MAG: dihydrolipoamide acetyltransferase family protein [Bacteroidota bacterium]
MALVDILMPQMGESLTEGTIMKWYKKVGDKIAKDETLFEISTDKVDSEIPCICEGIVAEILYPEQTTVAIHTVVARIETDSSVSISSTPSKAKIEEVKKVENSPTEIIATPIKKESSSSNKFFSPLVLNIAQAENVSLTELETIIGTGAEGRVTKKDIFDFVEKRKSPKTETTAKGKSQFIKMDTMRKAIAEHMIRSRQTSAHVGSVTEADVTKIVAFREKHKNDFEKREGFKLTFTPFFLDVVVRALKDFPLLNSSISGDEILIHEEINLGIAVALENGLIVPVIKNAESKNITELARSGNDLALRARIKKLLPIDVQGGTFTVTNPGIFGNLYGFPIINQPQVAILGIGAIKKRPVIVNDEITIRSMVYISMSYDHRIIDGALGGKYLQKIVEYLENFNETQKL